MAKPDPELLDPERYSFHCQLETRFSDLDANRHINNVAFTELLQEGRVRFHRASNYTAHSDDMRTMVVSLAIEYLGQGYFPDILEGHAAISRMGRTSFELNQLITQNGRVAVFARATLVCIADDRPREIPAEFAASARQWMFRA